MVTSRRDALVEIMCYKRRGLRLEQTEQAAPGTGRGSRTCPQARFGELGAATAAGAVSKALHPKLAPLHWHAHTILGSIACPRNERNAP